MIALGVVALLPLRSMADDRPRVGLALSGGGIKGFAQIGVLRVLEEIGLPIDYISGCSMGSIVGGLYAIGYSVDDLERLVIETDWNELFSDRMGRRTFTVSQKLWDERTLVTLPIYDKMIRLPSGLIKGQKISRLLSRLTLHVHDIDSFNDFPIPFVCVATDVETGEAVVLDNGSLAEAIRASLAVPSIFTPVEIGDRRLIDGGEVRTIPVEDVRRFNPDLVIAIDTTSRLYEGEQLRSFVTIYDQTMRFHKVESNLKQLKLADVIIRPDFKGISVTDFDKRRELITRGERAAREMIDVLRTVSDSIGIQTNHQARQLPTKSDEFYVTEIDIIGATEASERLLLKELSVDVPVRMTPGDIEGMVDRIYSLQLFERVTYQVRTDTLGSRLNVKVVEKNIDEFRFGLRYDSTNDAAVLLNTLFRNFASDNAMLNLDLRLASRIRADAQYVIPVAFVPSSGFRARLNYFEDFVDIFSGKRKEAQVDLNSFFFELLFGSLFSSTVAASVGTRAEYWASSTAIGSPALVDSLKVDESLFVFLWQIWIDTFDRATFPSSGILLVLKNEVAKQNFGSQRTFSRHFFDWRSVIPLGERVSALAEILLGTTSGDLPPFYEFALGDIEVPVLFPDRLLSQSSFLGLKSHELSGRHAQVFQIGVQFEFWPKHFALLRANLGNTFDRWELDFSPDRFESGIGLTLGRVTPIGPVELTFASGSRHDFLTHVNIGYRF